MLTEIAPVARARAASVTAALIVTWLGGCSSIRTEAPPDVRLSGHWVLDNSASDDVHAKVDHAIADAEEKFRKRRAAALAAAGYGGGGGTGGGGRGGRGGGGGGGGGQGAGADQTAGVSDDVMMGVLLGPDFEQLRTRLLQTLTPPAAMQVDQRSDLVTIGPDAVPPREYHPDEVFSRIDEYGTATIESGWSERAFVLRARYSGSVTREERYEVDTRDDKLTVSRKLNDPTVGRIALMSVYRRG